MYGKCKTFQLKEFVVIHHSEVVQLCKVQVGGAHCYIFFIIRNYYDVMNKGRYNLSSLF